MKIHSEIPLRNDTAKQERKVLRILDNLRFPKKLLQGNEPEPLDNPPYDGDKVFNASMLGICLVLAALMLIFGCFATPAHAYTDQEAIRTIVGEASSQGLIGMTAVGEVIRHRGSLKGFYGLHAKHSTNEPKWVWEQARKAWKASKHSNYTRMADHFENIKAFGCPEWVKSCVETFRYMDHVFYREVA